MKVVAIGAHPDDYEIGAAMRLQYHVKMHDDVVGIICSDGEMNGEKEIRIKEAEHAAESIGIKELYRLHFPDTCFPDLTMMKDCFEEIISRENPLVVYTHFRDDRHQDHEATSRATVIACRKVQNILTYKTPSTILTSFHPYLFHIGSEDDFLKKIAVLENHQSQIERDSGFNLEQIKLDSKFYGSYVNCYLCGSIYAEPFFATQFVLNSMRN